MHKYKALIRQEIKGVRWMFVYFSIIFIVFALNISSTLHRNYTDLIAAEIGSDRYIITNLFVLAKDTWQGFFIVLMGIGIIVLVLNQFSAYKDHDSSRFLKSLPIRGEKHFWVKVGCGVLSYTIPFLVFVIATFMIKANNTARVAGFYSVIGMQEIFQIIEGNTYVAKVLCIDYFTITAAYFLLVFMQYVVMWPKVSVIMSIIIGFVPYYIALIIDAMIYKQYPVRTESTFDIEEILACPWIYSMVHKWHRYEIDRKVQVEIGYIGDIDIRLMIVVILSVICFVLAYVQSKKFRVEELDMLMPQKLTRIIFIIGITVCCLCVPLFVNEYIVHKSIASVPILCIACSICALAGALIGKIIVGIGVRKKGGIGYEEV